MPGIIGKKIGMTSIYSVEGKALPCTIIEAGPCVVTQLKTFEKDGYKAVQLGFGQKKTKNINKAKLGHLKKSKAKNLNKLVEFNFDNEPEKLFQVAFSSIIFFTVVLGKQVKLPNLIDLPVKVKVINLCIL